MKILYILLVFIVSLATFKCVLGETLTFNLYNDMNYTRNNPISFSNNAFNLRNSKISLLTSINSEEFNLSQTNIKIDYTFKDYGYKRKWLINLTNPSFSSVTINYFKFDLEGCKYYNELVFHCGNIEIDFQDFKDSGYQITIVNNSLLVKSNIFSIFNKILLDPTDRSLPNSTNKAYLVSNTLSNNPFNATTEFTSSQYENINTSNNAYVNSYGKMYYTPIIEIKTGKDAGYDDLFMYTQITPSVLVKEEEEIAQDIVRKATHAVGLRSGTVHCELMKTPKGWKVIELASRTGGFREELLYYSFGLRHNLNDFLIHFGKKPILKKSRDMQTVFMKFWPHKSGKIVAIKGLKKAQALKSLVKFRQEKKVGDYAGLSKHGHVFVVGFTLCTKTRSELLADIRKLEKLIIIETIKRE